MTDPFAPPPAGGAPTTTAPAAQSTPLYGDPLPPANRNGLGTAALVLGIVSVLGSFVMLGVLLGPAAIVLGIQARRRVARGQASNRGRATAGMVLGIIGAALGAAVLALAIWVSTADRFAEFRDCQSSADTSEQQNACAELLSEALLGE